MGRVGDEGRVNRLEGRNIVLEDQIDRNPAGPCQPVEIDARGEHMHRGPDEKNPVFDRDVGISGLTKVADKKIHERGRDPCGRMLVWIELLVRCHDRQGAAITFAGVLNGRGRQFLRMLLWLPPAGRDQRLRPDQAIDLWPIVIR